MLVKALLSLRLLQSPLSLTFLICISWTLYLLQNSPQTQSQPTHIFTTLLRFLAAILTLPYVCWEIFIGLSALREAKRNNNTNNNNNISKFSLRSKSRSYKICRVLFEFGLAGLWFIALVFSLAVGSWGFGLGSDDATSASSPGSTVGFGGLNSTVTATTTGNAAVIQPTAASASQTAMAAAFIVPPGGKTPVVLGTMVWIGLIGLFSLSSLAVAIETIRNWGNGIGNGNGAGKNGMEMGPYSKGENV